MIYSIEYPLPDLHNWKLPVFGFNILWALPALVGVVRKSSYAIFCILTHVSPNQVVEFLLAQPEIDVNIRTLSPSGKYQITALMFACHNGHAEVVQRLIQVVCSVSSGSD